MKYWHFVIGLTALWMLSRFMPSLPMLIGLVVYVAVALAIAHSSLKHRSTGWISGMLLAGLLLTLPLWLAAMIKAYEWWQK